MHHQRRLSANPLGLRSIRNRRKQQSAGKQNESERGAGGNCARGGREAESVMGTMRRKWSPSACASMASSDPRIIA